MGSVDINNGERCNQRILTATPASCYRFVAWSDNNTDNPHTIRVTQDTILTANFERAVYTQAISHAICDGSTYTENGFNASEAGTYTQNLQTVNGCDSIITLNVVLSSLDEVEANDIKVNVYPNPANSYTVLEAQGLKEAIPVYLFDIQGRKLKEYIMNIGQETLRIDLGGLPKDVYTIMLGNITKKLIVE